MALEGGKVSVDLRHVSSLLPHEDVIESRTQEMVSQLRKDGVQKDPLIIDRDSGTVLDGMHRLSAFRRLGIEYAVCCLVDYSSRDISVGRWARVYRAASGADASRAIEELGFVRRSSVAEALEKLDKREASVGAFVGRECFLPAGRGGIDEGFGLVRRSDKLAEVRGWKRSFVAEDEVDVPLNSGESIVVLVSRLSKEDVLTAARTRRLFPCKTSMHVVDPRPVAVSVPLDELEEGSRRSLESRLGPAPFRVLPPNSTYEGRRYKERLLILSAQ